MANLSMAQYIKFKFNYNYKLKTNSFDSKISKISNSKGVKIIEVNTSFGSDIEINDIIQKLLWV